MTRAPRYLHGIPARAWHLRPWPPMHNQRHVKVRKQPRHALRLHIGLPVDGRQLTTRHLVHPLHPTGPPVAVLVVTMFQKAVNAFRNVTGEHSQAKRLNVLQHGIYILLKA